jgi:RES domain-containing protein
VHLTGEARDMRFLLYAITLPARARLRRYAHDAPGSPPVAASRAFGGAWLDEGATLGLVVPSVIVPRDTNYVLNVLHPQFPRLKIAEPEPFSFDERLWRSL